MVERQRLLPDTAGPIPGNARSGGEGLAWSGINYSVKSSRKDAFDWNDRVLLSEAGKQTEAVVVRREGDGYVVRCGHQVDAESAPTQVVKTEQLAPHPDSKGWVQLLRGVDGHIRKGRLCAVMGPSGAGKSSLLNILAGRVTANSSKRIEGGITIDGKAVDPVKFRKRVAYVMQEDALFATATPREALEFSAELRTNLSPRSRARRVQKTLQDLRLQKCCDTFVGNTLIPGISGGEKKRTAIGVELISDPDILFLDEPTSGLDSYAAHMVVDLLRRLAQGDGLAQRTVVCTIHQPSSEVFSLFDDVFLLSAGRVVYSGPRVDMIPFFSTLGYELAQGYNAADHVMFVMQTETIVPDEDDAGSLAKPKKLLADAWLERQGAERGLKRQGSSTVMEAAAAEGLRAKANILVQFKVLCVRESRNVLRDKGALIARFGSTIFLNIIVAFVFKGVGNTWDPDPNDNSTWPPDFDPLDPRLAVANHFGAVAQFAIGGMFGLSQPLLLAFPLERPVFLREYATGSYSAGAYFVSKALAEIPLTIAQAAVMYLCGYWLVEMQGNFLWLSLATALLGLVASSTALLIGAVAKDATVAVQLSPIIFVPQILFSGFFIRTTNIPEWLRWAQYLCALKYGTNLIAIAEFRDVPPEGYLDVYGEPKGLFPTNDIHKDKEWTYVGIMVGVFCAFRLLACVMLAHKARHPVS